MFTFSPVNFYCWPTLVRDSMIFFTCENSFYNVNDFINLYIYLQVRGRVINVKVQRLSLPGKGRVLSLLLSPPFSLMVWYFHGVYLATLVKKDSQASADSVLEIPSKDGLESRKGIFQS